MLDVVTLDPNTRFPKDLHNAVFVGLESKFFVSLSVSFCFSSGRDVSSTGCAEALPPKRLPSPENGMKGLDFGSSSSKDFS